MQDSHYDALYTMENAHWWYRVRRNLVETMLARRVRRLGHPLHILDIGCGTGQLMQEMGQFGTVEGIDISQRAVDYCKERGLSPVVASAEQLPFPDNAFDTLVILDVLEHLQDDTVGAKELARVLAPGGVAIVIVPAFNFLWSVTDEVSHHYRRYTRKEITAVLKKAGLQIERATYFNTFLFPAIAAVRLVVRLLHIPMQSENNLGGTIINRMLYAIFSAESKILPIFTLPFGVSILAVVKKIQ